jgi:hypothetical protein
MEAIHKRVAGIDVHRMQHTVTILIEQADGTVVLSRFGSAARLSSISFALNRSPFHGNPPCSALPVGISPG